MSHISTNSLIKSELGNRHGKWTVIGAGPSRGRAFWLCRCECGVESYVSGTDLRNGNSTMCRDCGAKVGLEAANKVPVQDHAARCKPKVLHGHTRSNPGETSTYCSWRCMKARCTNPRYRFFYLYGGRGIRVCDRWLHSFETFLSDMGERPSGMTLDRIDPDGNYEPSNCRWATRKTQRSNQRLHDCKSGGVEANVG